MTTQKDVQELLDILAAKGNDAYFGEQVSVLEHCLQCAHFAERSHASPSTIAAALLHDIGHILHDLPEDYARQGKDGWHEEIGAKYLSHWFDEAVTEPVRLHVAAKRYLCATDPSYISRLSDASIESMQVQGGIMSSEEASAFAALPNAALAVQLRFWDEEAKIIGLEVPGLPHYLPILHAALREPVIDRAP
jgi:phosphonate degradation associated HDIG domain protein